MTNDNQFNYTEEKSEYDLYHQIGTKARKVSHVSENEKNEDIKEPEESEPLQDSLKDDKKEPINDKNKNVTLYERYVSMKNNITVEPIMACYIMPSVLAGLATQNLNLEKACRVNLKYSEEVCTALNLRQTENYTMQEEEVQKLIASVQAWKNIVQTTIPVLLILFVGAWSDKTGKRKACILIPIIGEFLSCIGFIVNTFFFYELPVEAIALTEAVFPAITGGWFTMFMGVFSYIGDVTSAEERTFRVGIVNLCMSLGFPVGMALSGILLHLIGYYGVFSTTALLYGFSLTYGYFYLNEPRKENIEMIKTESFFDFMKSFFDIEHVKNTLKTVFKDGPRNRRLRIIFLITAVCFIYGPMHGEYTVMYLFARFRFNWDEVQFSVFSTYSFVTNLVGTLFSMSVFTNYLKYDDTLLGIISLLSKILASFVYALARTDFEIYMAPLAEILNGTSFVAMRSIASKLVPSEELGKVMSLFGLAEATMPLVYGPLYSRVYMNTIDVMPGAVFLLGAALTIPALLIFIWLYRQHKQEYREQAMSHEKNEPLREA